MKQSTMIEHFQLIISMTKKEKEVMSWVKLIIEKGLSLVIVYDASQTTFYQAQEEVNLSKTLVQDAILAMFKLVEDAIRQDMQKIEEVF